ncbi:MAG: rod shape-determining protein MreC [Deltaproteobacteria bacterium]|jgi:rod shape-determining protein MreC|nr:rod shape-determining protein MreC [Deltaproteobacteria bacterium]
MRGKTLKTALPLILVLVSLAILSFFIFSPGSSKGSVFGSASLEAAGPLSSVTSGLAGFVEDLWQDYFQLVDVKEENQNLKRQLAQKGQLQGELTEMRMENGRLREILSYRDRAPGRFLTAKVLAKDPTPYFRSIIIAAGAADGLLMESAVISPLGAVGRICELSPHYARVLLITDLSSAVDSLIQRNRVNGLMAGTGTDRLGLEYVQKAEDVRVGDSLVTSGLDGIFPPGIPLGTVTFVDKMSMGFFMHALVSPAVDFGSLEEVLILLDAPAPLDWMGVAPNVRSLYEKGAPKRE